MDNIIPESQAVQALQTLDERWYRRTKLKGSRIDVLGGFVGTELFILDGTFMLRAANQRKPLETIL